MSQRLYLAGSKPPGLMRAAPLLLILLVGCDNNPFSPDASLGAIKACEQVLLTKLSAPSTYVRISAEYFEEEPFSYDEYQTYELTKYCGVGDSVSPCTGVNNMMVSMGAKALGEERKLGKPSRKQANEMRKLYWKQAYERYKVRDDASKRPGKVFIKYDAANSFGTPIRGLEMCSFGPRSGDKFSPTDLYDSNPDASLEIE